MVKILLFMVLIHEVFGQGFFKEHAEGWHWYHDPAELANDDTEEVKPSTPEVQKRTPTDTVKAYREELEQRLNRAWLHPTPQNLKSYQIMQNDLLNRSERFSTVWKQVLFETPSLDHSLIWPINQKARHVYVDEQKRHSQETIQALSQSYGLFFFFSGECPYCHAFAPILKQFSETYGWNVIAVSVDGGAMDGFPNAQRDPGLRERWSIDVLPSVFAVNPTTEEVITVAHGLTTLDEMETRILTLVGAS